jgi:hypothetical protein
MTVLNERTLPNNSVITSKDSKCFIIQRKSTDFFRKTISVYSDNFTKCVEIVCGKKNSEI